MAVGIHVVYIVPKPVNAAGTVMNKDEATIAQMMHGSTEPRVMADAAIPSSAGFPTIKAYLEAEAAANFVARHISATMIVTYNEANVNDA